jgi:hypothetical protein
MVWGCVCVWFGGVSVYVCVCVYMSVCMQYVGVFGCKCVYVCVCACVYVASFLLFNYILSFTFSVNV